MPTLTMVCILVVFIKFMYGFFPKVCNIMWDDVVKFGFSIRFQSGTISKPIIHNNAL